MVTPPGIATCCVCQARSYTSANPLFEQSHATCPSYSRFNLPPHVLRQRFRTANGGSRKQLRALGRSIY